MSDCVTVSDATILYCSDDDDAESTCYVTVGGGATHEHSNQQLDSSSSDASEQHEYDVPQELLDTISCSSTAVTTSITMN